jgi:hypothetical protein
MNESYGSVNSHWLWACANTNNPYKVGDGSIFIPDFPRFVMNDDVHVLIKENADADPKVLKGGISRKLNCLYL